MGGWEDGDRESELGCVVWVRKGLFRGGEGLEQKRGVRGVVRGGGLRVLWIYIYNFSIIAAVMVWYRHFHEPPPPTSFDLFYLT